MPDIKIKRYADKENLKKLVKYSKDTFVNKNGDTLGDAAIFNFPDSGSSLDDPASIFPLKRGGLHWAGQSDWVTLQAVETASDCLDLQAQFGDSPTNNEGVNGFGIVDCLGNVNARIDCLGNATFKSITARNITGNVTGNASTATTATTATKLAAKRTIALSGAATGTATAFDGSGNITIPVTALSPSAIRAQWYAAYPDGAEAHNAMWGGRNITAAFDAGTVSTNISNGTFKDIFLGDYITKQVTIPQVLADDGTTVIFAGGTYTVNWVVADCDYWINKGDDPVMTTHHVAIVPQAPIFRTRMNPANTTEGGYAGSRMYRETIPACATGIVNAFGSSHILAFRDHLTRDLNTSAVSSGITVLTGTPNWNGAWYSQQCNLMSEAMVYNGPHCASSALDNITATRQMSAFRLSERLINYNRSGWWLRDVVSSASFAGVPGDGCADAHNASFVYGVRPFALLK